MLVLTRKPEETIKIAENIVIKVIKTAKGTVKLGIDAPADIRIVRGELVDIPKTECADETLPRCVFTGIASDQFPHVA